MSKRIHILAIFFIFTSCFLILGLSFPVYAEDISGTIYGVYGVSSTVEITAWKSPGVVSGSTEVYGTSSLPYTVSVPAAEYYTLEAYCPGYAISVEANVLGGTTGIDFTLSRGWPTFKQDRWHTGNSPDTELSPPLKLRWSYPTGGNIGYSSPAVVDGVVYIGSLDNKVYALYASDGSLKWSYPTGDVIHSSPAVVDGVVYIGSQDNKVYALYASDGGLKWSHPTGQYINSSPIVANGVVYIGSTDKNVYALYASDGGLKWSYYTTLDILSSPAVVDGVVYIGSQSKNVYARNASDGSFKWNYLTGSFIGYSSPAVVDGVVYIGSQDNKVYALYASDGSFKWSYPTGNWVYSSPTVANGVVYVGSLDNKVYALYASDGSLKWSYPTGGYVQPSPSVANGRVYVGSNDKNIYALNESTGNLEWNYTTGGGVGSSPSVANGRVYMGSSDNKVYAFEAAVPTPQTINPTRELPGVTIIATIEGYFYDGVCAQVPTVELTREGYSPIVGSVTTWEGNSITASFDLTGADSGKWDVKVTNNPNGKYGTTSEVFTVVGVPSAPTGFTGSAESTTSIRWSWEDVAEETGYRIYSSPGDVLKGTVGTNVTTFEETGLVTNTAYTRYVTASNEAGESGPSNTWMVYTLAGPAAPSYYVPGRAPLTYPTPFRPLEGDILRIGYALPDNSDIAIYVYSISGEIVKTFRFRPGMNGGKAGDNTVEWNGVTDFGRTVGNGMYVYKIISRGKVIGSGKIVVLD